MEAKKTEMDFLFLVIVRTMKCPIMKQYVMMTTIRTGTP